MENKKRNRVPTSCKTDYSIILPDRVFENCFTGDWSSTVGNTLDKSIRISFKKVTQKCIYMEFWKKGKSDFTIVSNQSNFDGYLYKSSVIKGHWEKQEILIKLKTASTQSIQLVIKSEDNKMFFADDLTIYMLNN